MGLPVVAVVDYGVGNLFSVAQALRRFDLNVEITGDWRAVQAADAVVLPGVGAFGPAMQRLRELELDSVIRDVAAMGKPLMGICLGLQLLGRQSSEFGHHEGLGIIDGSVVQLPRVEQQGRVLKLPNIGWQPVLPAPGNEQAWGKTLLCDVPQGTTMYFVHTFALQVNDPDVCVAVSGYGDHEFCAAVASGSVFACQFHPERSGETGLRMYGSFAKEINEYCK
ncbi:imidazole glycerol phosphate synthase subunit HisH [Pseudodesulfovibrio senegalensis]|jgi:glutamine amidotransferase|uniref:Imidazole glycerol phosphate synthase subunit HisH n=1 Tax=Pseudodesulfovibrio senegalensis TaxID=1721087 RepID=A0A6N6N067_9BACT|nr:imidazole glycerol phosphate synthase subunit HisH [Pseudodesulfovibrio senegalensis]KAB1441297.1 imidazole glycerol phosphate synthase subunit HisH [Pseudodesulfovibrio senegalensis]